MENQKPNQDRRDRIRIIFKAQVIIKTGYFVKNIVMTLKNISMSGLLADINDKVPADTNDILPVGKHCDIAVIVPGKSSKLVLHIKGKISRHTETGVAIRFDDELEWWSIFSMFKNYSK